MKTKIFSIFLSLFFITFINFSGIENNNNNEYDKLDYYNNYEYSGWGPENSFIPGGEGIRQIKSYSNDEFYYFGQNSFVTYNIYTKKNTQIKINPKVFGDEVNSPFSGSVINNHFYGATNYYVSDTNLTNGATKVIKNSDAKLLVDKYNGTNIVKYNNNTYFVSYSSVSSTDSEHAKLVFSNINDISKPIISSKIVNINDNHLIEMQTIDNNNFIHVDNDGNLCESTFNGKDYNDIIIHQINSNININTCKQMLYWNNKLYLLNDGFLYYGNIIHNDNQLFIDFSKTINSFFNSNYKHKITRVNKIDKNKLLIGFDNNDIFVLDLTNINKVFAYRMPVVNEIDNSMAIVCMSSLIDKNNDEYFAFTNDIRSVFNVYSPIHYSKNNENKILVIIIFILSLFITISFSGYYFLINFCKWYKTKKYGNTK